MTSTNPMDLLAKAKAEQAKKSTQASDSESVTKEEEFTKNDSGEAEAQGVPASEAYRFPSAPITVCYIQDGAARKVTLPEGVAVIQDDTPEELVKMLRGAFKAGNCIKHSPKIPLETRQRAPGSLYTQPGVTVGKAE